MSTSKGKQMSDPHANNALNGYSVLQNASSDRLTPLQRPPLRNFNLIKTSSGGWVITNEHASHSMYIPEWAFTDTKDMLSALPAIVGFEK